MDRVTRSFGARRSYARVGRLMVVLLIGASLAACAAATATPSPSPAPTPTASHRPTPGFSPTGSMATGRTVHTATLLAAGRVLIAGGSAGTVSTSDRYVPLTSAELYDTKSGTFGPAGSMITAREYQTTTLLSDGRVLIAGGLASLLGDALASAELYQP